MMTDQNEFPSGALDEAGMTRAREAGWVPLFEHEKLQAEFDAAREDIDKRTGDLQGQVDSLANTILELDMRGTDDAGACGVAEARLREFATAKADLATARSELEKGDEDFAAEKKRADAAEAKLADNLAENEEIQQLKTDLEAANKRADEAEAKAKAKPKRVAAGAAEAKPRQFKAIGEDKLLARDGEGGLKEKLAGAEKVEIALIDDKGKEIRGSRPFEISGDVWKDHGPDRLLLTEPVEIIGPSESGGYSVGGYALLVDGKHVATQIRSDPFNVAPGSKHKIEGDIIF